MDQTPAEIQPTFSDARGRQWAPRLDYVRLREIRDDLRVDLGNVEQMGRTWAELLYDDLKALETIWLAIGGSRGTSTGEPGIKHDGTVLTKDDWLAAMDGELLDGARAALKAAIIRFTPPLRRSILQQGLEAVDKSYHLAIAEAQERLANETDAAIERALAAARSQVRGTDAPKSPAGSAGSMTAGV